MAILPRKFKFGWLMLSKVYKNSYKIDKVLADFFRPLIFLQPLDLQERTVPHLKDLVNICLENVSQGHGMTSNIIYDCSKYPHFISYRGLC